MALTKELSDNFTSNSRDAAKWTQFGVALGTLPSQSNGQLVFTTSTTNGYGGYDSVAPFATLDLTQSYALIQLVSAGNQALTSLEIQPIGLIADASNAIGWYLNGNTLAAWKKVATARSNVATVAYNSTNHQWLRIRENLGTTFWDTSTDGVTWSNFTSLANPITVTTLQAEISVGTFANELSATTVLFDNYNIVPLQMSMSAFAPGQTWLRRFAKNERHPYFVAKPLGTAYTQNLTGGVSFVGSTTLRTNKALTGVLSFTGTLNKRLSRSLTGGLNFTGNLVKSRLVSFTAGLSFSGTFSKRTGKALSGSLSFTGALARAVRKVLTAGLSFTGSLRKRLARTFTASLGFTGSLRKDIRKVFSGGLSFSALLATLHLLPASVFTPLRAIVSSFTNRKTQSGASATETDSGATRIETLDGSVTIEEIDGQIKNDTLDGGNNRN